LGFKFISLMTQPCTTHTLSLSRYAIAVSQAKGEYQLAPLCDFAESAVRKGWPEMADPKNWPVASLFADVSIF
jgi:hypothetical protein